jgi:hypothetical protein
MTAARDDILSACNRILRTDDDPLRGVLGERCLINRRYEESLDDAP